MANIDKWGKSENTNILYITGVSGSGKSTAARALADKNTNLIHLDAFFEKMDKNVKSSIVDKEFKQYLDRNMPDYKKITTDKRHTKEWFNKVDTLMEHTEKFSKQQFNVKKKVIVEGVQLADDTTYPNKTFFKNKPLIIVNTSSTTSMRRAWDRDDKTGEISKESMREYVQWYGNMKLSLVKLSNISNANKGSKWVDDYFKKL